MPYNPLYGNLNDDDLLSLGRQAGVIPHEDAPYTDMESPEPPPQGPAPDAGYIDMESPEPAAPQPAPTPQMAQPQLANGAPALPSVQPGQSYGAGHRGFSGSSYDQITGKEGDLERDQKAADRWAVGNEGKYIDAAQQGAESTREGAKAVAQAKADQIMGNAEQSLVMQRLQDGFAVEEAKANAAANAMATQSKHDYMTALADFRASRVDPSQLWSNMNGGERFGMLAAAFVHDFLGVRGINTSAMATFNKAIDRNIDAQIQNIKTKGEAAEGFKSLWYMQRNQSASDAEARTRVRGFLLEGAKHQVIANMAKYESALASAQGKAAIAEIDGELAKTMIQIYKHTDDNAIAMRNQALEKWRAKLQASLEQQNINLKQQELDQAKIKALPQTEILMDPETHQPKWYFPTEFGIKDEEKIAARNMLENVMAVNRDLKELEDLVRNNPAYPDMTGQSRFAGTAQQRFDALAKRVAHGMVKANDERATDKDVEQYEMGFRNNTWFNRADAEKVIAATRAQLLRIPQSKLAVIARDIPKGLEGAWGSSASGKPMEASYAEANAIANPPKLSPEQKAFENSSKLIAGEQSQQEYMGENSTLTKIHKDLQKQYPDQFGQEDVPAPQMFGGMQAPNIPGMQVKQRPAPIRNFERGLMEYYTLAKQGYKPAVEALEGLARAGSVKQDAQTAMAQYLLLELHNED